MECLIISGMSGAGKSVAVDALEDIGYFCVDNMPAALIPQFAELFMSSSAKYNKVAFVCDVRGEGDFQMLFETLESIRRLGVTARILFLDCSDEALIDRHKATRRRHPLDVNGKGIAAAVAEERRLLEPVRVSADFLIDTTALPNGGLRAHIQNLFGEDGGSVMVISVNTFGYKYGIPHESDLVFDVRCLKNPYYIPELRYKTGMDDAVYDYVFSGTEAEELSRRLLDLLLFLIPLYIREGKTSLVISVGCTGGRHRSVAVGRRLQGDLEKAGYQAILRHRDYLRD
ncbi:MAG: RNase adapter RapZ [Clostridiaceae bacterium]|nr:RNase adapter RapZ [Clostridiaceae bacterium]